MNDAPRYPLTAIPPGTPKPKSLTISAFVDENMRRIIVDYAEKLGIAVVPVEGSRLSWTFKSSFASSFDDRDWIVADHHTDLKSATATAMREYLARLLYGDEGLVGNLLADESKTKAAPTTKIPTETTANDNRPTRVILRSYAADDKPRIERLLGLARQLQIPVQLAGPWSCTAFPKDEEAHPALDVVFPEVLVHPRDVLILGPATSTYESGRSFGEELAYVENRLLWAAREDDQRFITGLIELLGLPADASRGDIAAAVEAKDGDSEIGVITSHQLAECHRQRARYEECDAQVREILGASQGEEAVEAAKRVMAELDERKRELASWENDATALRQEAAENQRELLADINEALGLHPEQSLAGALQRAKWLVEQNKFQTEKLAEILGWKSNDFSALLEKVQRVIREHQTLLGERIESNAKIDQLCASLNRERDKLRRHAESAQNNNAVEQLNAIHVRILHILGPDASTAGIFDSVEKVVKERDNLEEKLDTVHRDLVKRLGLPKDAGWNDIVIAVERIVGDSRNPVEIRANNKELGVKLAREYDRNLHLRAALDTAEKDRDALKERLETAITAERQTVAQRIDLALTGNAVATHLDTMLRAVGNSRRDTKILQNLISQIADALDAPSEEKAFTNDDGSLNTALVDRIVGYYKRLYTAAGYSEPPQGGWEELLTHIRKYTGFKPETPVTWPKPQNTDNSKE